jgi:hypothetical protein
VSAVAVKSTACKGLEPGFSDLMEFARHESGTLIYAPSYAAGSKTLIHKSTQIIIIKTVSFNLSGSNGEK